MKHLIKRIVYFMIRKWLSLKYRSISLKKGSQVNINSYFEGKNTIGINSNFFGKMGFCSYIGSNCSINAIIGKYTCIGSNVKTIAGTHPVKTFVSIHPMFYSIQKQNGFTYVKKNKFDELLYADSEKFSVIIGNDVWIGSNVIIKGGIKIGDGAVIAMGAVVTKDVLPYQIVGGVPAKEIKKRFSQEQIEKLIKIKWWNNSEKWILEKLDLFDNIDKFLNQIEEEKNK